MILGNSLTLDSLALIFLAVSPATSSTGSGEIRSLCPHNVKMFEPNKLSEVLSALFPGLFPNAQEHSKLRLRLNRTEPASGAFLTLRMGSQRRTPDCAPRHGGSSRRGLPSLPRELVVSRLTGFSLLGVTYRLGKRTRRHNCLLSRDVGVGCLPTLGLLTRVGEVMGSK